MSNKELDDILAVSRRNNTSLNISGMLLYYEGAFMQVLEGEESIVESVYRHISKDARHNRITRLLEERMADRNFPDWSMGFQRLTSNDVSNIDGYNRLADIDQFLEYFADSPHNSLSLLKSFRTTSQR